MVSPHPLSWADAPPYHYHGTTLPPPAPAKDDGAVAVTVAVARAGAGQDEGARSLWIGGLLHWMNEDYLYACFTYSPEILTTAHKELILITIQTIQDCLLGPLIKASQMMIYCRLLVHTESLLMLEYYRAGDAALSHTQTGHQQRRP